MERFSLTRKEAADFIGIDADTLSNWCKSGRISYTKKNPNNPKSPFLFTRQACIAALNNPLQTVPVSAADAHKEKTKCLSSAGAISGMRVSRRQTVAELNNLLGHRTKGKRLNSTTN